MSGIAWHYVLKFIITGDAAVGKSSLLIRLTDQRFLANPDPTLGVEFGSKLITIPEEDKVVKLQCWDTAGTESFRAITRSYYRGAAGCLLVYDVTSRKSFLNARNWLKDVREHADPNLTCILVGNKVDLCGDDDIADASSASASTSTSTATDPPSDSQSQSNSTGTSSGTGTNSRKSGSGGTVKGHSRKPSGQSKVREVSREEGEKWAKEEGLLFVEASAKSGQNVELAFVEASRDILGKIRRGVFDDDRSPGVKLSKPNTDLTLEQNSASSGGCCSS
ncbi:rab GTPase [Coprinopsis cinerea okayama7|uniref:Rab GTPase n=1 Tax=Coprinopsis cinerea (strain Okayama-7 / 130 / ATCC MYA-4618 / FGSC 9003) TaxID=240176 RepID=A8PG41_COPC7|nr:rab GTPase [Coprinopsis cinerea okayama7\|eukprot:XP_001841142.1 rab GTPase [Coprinopsis cinerea okayama7\